MGSLGEPSLSLFVSIRKLLPCYQQVRLFVFINFTQLEDQNKFHGKPVALDPNHEHSPFRAPFLIHEMRTRGFYPWFTDQPIPCPSSPYSPLPVDNSGDGGA
jgi:hypothetical protein